jgi:protein-S-isoprenylcysteine O-methyltransferase Ste14
MLQPVGILVLVTFVILSGQLVYLAFRGRIGSLGKPPTSRLLFFLAKLCIVISMLCLVIELQWGRSHRSAALTAPFLLFWLGGAAILVISFRRLGTNLRMGIPLDQTALVTCGIYRLSRNPIYLGLHCLMVASLIYAFSLLNLVAVVEAVLLHHRIILAEEKFLGEQFQEYEAYRASVPRYIWLRDRS